MQYQSAFSVFRKRCPARTGRVVAGPRLTESLAGFANKIAAQVAAEQIERRYSFAIGAFLALQ
jgi:hypothetical protein